MKTATLTALQVAALAVLPAIACAQMASPKPLPGSALPSSTSPSSTSPSSALPGSKPDALELLHQAAAVYAQAAPPFHIESSEETLDTNEYEHNFYRSTSLIILAPGDRYHVELRSPYENYDLLSDGKLKWYSVPVARVYTQTAASAKPEQGRTSGMSFAAEQAFDTPKTLKAELDDYSRATLLGEETVVLGDRTFRCYRIHTTSEDRLIGKAVRDFLYEDTFWIDETDHVLRKHYQKAHSAIYLSPMARIPFDEEKTTVYPVVDFSPHLDPAVFRFTPGGEQRVESLERDTPGKFILLGKPAPDVVLTGADGSKLPLRSLRGKPVLLDFWATWCGPCAAAMPQLAAVQQAAVPKGLVFFTINQDAPAANAVKYLQQHNYTWPDYNDADESLSRAFYVDGVPLTVLIDATGVVVYDETGGNDASLRRALAKLGPEFKDLAPSGKRSKPAADADLPTADAPPRDPR